MSLRWKILLSITAAAVAVIVTVPAVAIVNNPVWSIVAEPVPFVTAQVTVLLVAFTGKTVALYCRTVLTLGPFMTILVAGIVPVVEGEAMVK